MTGLIDYAGRGNLRPTSPARQPPGLARSTSPRQSTTPAALSTAVSMAALDTMLAQAKLRSDRSVNEPLTEFTLFKYLAPELRLKICMFQYLRISRRG
jgi:hypothetical protein